MHNITHRYVYVLSSAPKVRNIRTVGGVVYFSKYLMHFVCLVAAACSDVGY
jgi:hypothetical protein